MGFSSNHNKISRRRGQGGFTLVELLVVIAVIALLVSILVPALGMAKDTAKRIFCSANLRSLSVAAIHYSEEQKGRTPS